MILAALIAENDVEEVVEFATRAEFETASRWVGRGSALYGGCAYLIAEGKDAAMNATADYRAAMKAIADYREAQGLIHGVP